MKSSFNNENKYENGDLPDMEGREGIKQEYAFLIMEALSGVEEDLLERCNEENTGKKARAEKHAARSRSLPIRKFAGAWAAVLCLAVAGAASWGGYLQMRNMEDGASRSGGSGSASQENSITGMGGATQGEYAEPGAAEALPESTAAEDRAPEGKKEMYEVPGQECGQADGNAIPDFENLKNNCADKTDVSGGAEQPEERSEEDAVLEKEGCLRLNARNYTEEEAGKQEEFMGYIPDKLPEGYVFESAYSNLDLEEQNLTICWSRGMDIIVLSLHRTESAVATVDIDKPETYDERLYEIPFGDTVPAEYREAFNDPVFAWGDLNLEIIRSRMLAYEDSGDTAVPRGNFKVLYPDGMLLDFNGRGTAEEIWDMLCSISASFSLIR